MDRLDCAVVENRAGGDGTRREPPELDDRRRGAGGASKYDTLGAYASARNCPFAARCCTEQVKPKMAPCVAPMSSAQ